MRKRRRSLLASHPFLSLMPSDSFPVCVLHTSSEVHVLFLLKREGAGSLLTSLLTFTHVCFSPTRNALAFFGWGLCWPLFFLWARILSTHDSACLCRRAAGRASTSAATFSNRRASASSRPRVRTHQSRYKPTHALFPICGDPISPICQKLMLFLRPDLLPRGGQQGGQQGGGQHEREGLARHLV